MTVSSQFTRYPMGYPLNIQPTQVTAVLALVTDYVAMAFIPAASKTISKVKIYLSAVSTTLQAGDLRCAIWSETAGGTLNASLSSTTTITALPSGAGWIEFTGLSQAVTVGTPYFIVIDGPVGVRTATVAYSPNIPVMYGGAGNLPPFITKFITAASTQTPNAAAYRIEYSDGSFAGWPIAPTAAFTSAQRVTGATETGVSFTVPNGPDWTVAAVEIPILWSSTPTGTISVNVYNGSGSLLTTSQAIPKADTTSSLRPTMFYLVTPVTMTHNQTYYVTLKNSATETSTNAYASYTLSYDNNANSKALMPFGGTLTMVQTADGGATFTTTNVAQMIMPIALLLDDQAPFVAATVPTYGFAGGG